MSLSLKDSFEMQQPPSPVSFQQMPICKSPIPVLSLAGSGWFPDQECLGRHLLLSFASELPISLRFLYRVGKLLTRHALLALVRYLLCVATLELRHLN